MSRWVDDKARFGHGENFYMGRYKVGHAGYNLSRTKSDPDTTTYRATSYMPGIKDQLGTFATMTEAKQRVEDVAAQWYRGLTDET